MGDLQAKEWFLELCRRHGQLVDGDLIAASVQLQVCCWAVLPAGSLPGQGALQHKGRCQSPPSIHKDELH